MIFKMNKKGEGMTTREIVLAVVGVTVLVLVAFFVYSFFAGKAIPFFDFLPSFNQTKPPVVSAEIFGYDISSDKLQYYDGAAWIQMSPISTNA